MPPVVGIIKEGRPRRIVREGLSLIGGLGSYIREGSRVLVKPNLCSLRAWETGATTDPKLTKELLSELMQITHDIAIVESDHAGLDAETVFDKLGFREVALELGIGFINLSRGKLKEVHIPNGLRLKRLELHEVLLDEHWLINLPVMKTSEVSGISLSVKNLFGLLPYRMKAKFHPSINEAIFDLACFFRRSLVILDARVGMEGNGPMYGDPVQGDFALVGSDQFAVDAVAVSAMGFDPWAIPYLRLAEEMGASRWSAAKIVGTPLAQIRRNFRVPKQAPIRRRVSYRLQESPITRPVLERGFLWPAIKLAAKLLAKKGAPRQRESWV